MSEYWRSSYYLLREMNSRETQALHNILAEDGATFKYEFVQQDMQTNYTTALLVITTPHKINEQKRTLIELALGQCIRRRK